MGKITISQARENLAEVIESTQRSGEHIVLTRHGRPVAVVLEHAAFERLVAAAEDASDRAVLALAPKTTTACLGSRSRLTLAWCEIEL